MRLDPKLVVFWLVILMVVSFTLGMAVVWAGGGVQRGSNSIHTGSVHAVEWEMQSVSESVDLEGTTSADVRIAMRAGDLMVREGTGPLMAGTFSVSTKTPLSNAAEWQPEIEQHHSGDHVTLVLQYPELNGARANTLNATWDITLNRNVPMGLEVVLGAGESRLDLGGLNLTSLDIRTGVGETTLDLIETSSDLDVEVHAGVGNLQLQLPRDTGVRIEVEKGLGDVLGGSLKQEGTTYTNSMYGRSDATLNIVIHQGIGTVQFEEG